MMTEEEFISAVQFKPWVNRGDTLDAMDCYGLVKLYYEHVQGAKLPIVSGYKEGHQFDSLWRKEIEKTWRQSGRFKQGDLVTFYDASMKPSHVGICVANNKVLHARGSVGQGGKVEMHSISTLQAAYKTVTFHTLVK